MDDIAVLFEHVHLLNRLNGLHVEFFQRSLQLLVIGARGLVNLLLFPPWCAFAPGNSCKSALQTRYVRITAMLQALRRAGAVVIQEFKALEALLTLQLRFMISIPK